MSAKTFAAMRDGKNTKAAVRDAVAVVQSTWIAATMGKMLPGMSQPIRNHDYAVAVGSPEAIQVPDEGPLTGAVVSTYSRTRMIEQGTQGFDMKPLMLTGPKARMGENGPYTIIPFRHATPKTQASSGIFSSRMPQEIYNRAKRQQYGQSMTEKTLHNIDSKRGTTHGQPQTNPSSGYQHTSPLYARLTKTGAPRHSQYYTFRTVSQKSNPMAFLYPAVPPNPIMKAVADYARPQIEQIIKAGVQADMMAAFGS